MQVRQARPKLKLTSIAFQSGDWEAVGACVNLNGGSRSASWPSFRVMKREESGITKCSAALFNLVHWGYFWGSDWARGGHLYTNWICNWGQHDPDNINRLVTHR